MRLLSRDDRNDIARNGGLSDSAGKERRLVGLFRRVGKKSERLQHIEEVATPSATAGYHTKNGHVSPGERSAIAAVERPLPISEDSSTRPSLWDRAYASVKRNQAVLLECYEELLNKELRMATPIAPDAEPPNDVTINTDGPSRQANLQTIIDRGLLRMEDKTKYIIAGHEFVPKEQVAKAAELVLWAKSWIGEAAKASPDASVAWAGVCLILPLLTNAKTADEANRDGFTYVTTRMRYYAALEPLVSGLGQVDGISDDLLAEANSYVRDTIIPGNWKQMRLDIEKLESTVNNDISQINELASTQELAVLDKTSKGSLDAMQRLLSVSERQLRVIEDHRDIAQKQLEMQEDMVKQNLSERQQKCLQVFRLTSMDKDVTYEWYKVRVEDRVQDTCLWFLRHDKFQQWLDQESGSLLVSADPGCGKSALCAILHQLFSQRPFLIDHAMDRFGADGDGLPQSTMSLWATFCEAVRDRRAGQVIVVLDALDECDESEFKNLMFSMKHYFDVRKPGADKLRFLLTSRPYEQIASTFVRLSDAIPHSVRRPGEDESETISQEINLVIKHRVEQLAVEKRIPEHVKDTLLKELLSVPHRTYLWVHLVFDYLRTEDFKKTPKGVQSTVETLPKTVEQAYEGILGRSKDRTMVRKVLSIILAATRPLSVSEMNVAVNLEDTSQSLDDIDLEEEENFKTRLRSWCGLFVSIYNNRVYLLHLTAREFLLADGSQATIPLGVHWRGSIAITHTHRLVAELCVRYLDLFRPQDLDDEEDMTSYMHGQMIGDPDVARSFLDYATEAWAVHFRAANIADHDAIVPLAARLWDRDCTSFIAVSKPYWRILYSHHNAWRVRRRPSALTLPSFLGLNPLVKHLIKEGADVEEREAWFGHSPLLMAASQGHLTTVQLLLNAGAEADNVSIESAVSNNDKAIVQLMLENGAEPSRVLYSAAAKGLEDIVRLLLDNGADIEGGTHNQFATPLAIAVKRGHTTTAQLLLDRGADIEGNKEDRPLRSAVGNEEEAAVRLLLKRGADTRAGAGHGRTLLHWAAIYNSDPEITQLLLESGLEVDARDSWGRTPLLCSPSPPVARLLVQNGADIKAKDSHGRSAVFHANMVGTIHVMAEMGADVDAKDDYGVTPLSRAASDGDPELTQALIECGAYLGQRSADEWVEEAFNVGKSSR
ncbi:hypothetical protein GE09DRAFT_1289546 [Coniochaeta sp. 2T2.1]|nr:hypothetical protein GE09DRAFT_1289546 [Coniochaeta sp. 2T2.1]